jgi:hypothetical protein
LAIKVAFEVLGLAGLLVARANVLQIAVLLLQEAWLFGASFTLML